eukprot:6392750-Prymnesium_polylepis.1
MHPEGSLQCTLCSPYAARLVRNCCPPAGVVRGTSGNPRDGVHAAAPTAPMRSEPFVNYPSCVSIIAVS